MGVLAAPVHRPLVGPYARIDAGWKTLIATGPKWFMDRVWHTCLSFVRTSNAWPRPTDPNIVTFHYRVSPGDADA